MIKANELRIGNWVLFDNDSTQFKVADISKGGIGVENPDEETWIELDQFSGIPLTPEILEACGVESTGNMALRKFWKLGNLTFELCADERIAIYFKDELLCFINYLHQLQNIFFSVWGEELNYTPTAAKQP